MVIIDVTIWLIEPGEPSVELFATMKSAGRSEFAAAGTRGNKAGRVFVVFAAEFSGQEQLEFEGERLSIYRTFNVPNSDKIELYTEERAGKR